LWISATENLRRFEEAGVADRVFPIQAEAHALPYVEGFFDAAVSIDSYHYYGADEAFFPCTFSKLVKPGGQFGIVVPGFTKEFDSGYPETLRELWEGEMFTFHSKDWWRRLWGKTGIAEITACYDIDDPKDMWRPWAVWSKENMNFNDEELLAADVHNDIALIAMAARKK